MECPHCSVGVHESWELLGHPLMGTQLRAPGESDVTIRLLTMECPACRKLVACAQRDVASVEPSERRIVYPFDFAERTAPKDVPDQLRSDYAQATAILNRSPQASAALSRRIVQQVLRDQGAYAKRNLSDQIQAFIDDPKNPSEVKKNIDYLREIGNFAAHPVKSDSTGEVIPVEPGEAEWAIEVVDSLFDFYFVSPARNDERRRAFDARIAEAGRSPLTDDS